MMQSAKRISYLGVLLGLLTIFLCQNASAQVNRATITGIVTDPSGAAVVGADVTATNTGTNVPTKTVSNQVGIYVLPNLFPGQYSVTFEKSGFEALVRPGITLNSTQEARIDAVLKIGAATASVTVYWRRADSGYGYRLCRHQHEGRRGERPAVEHLQRWPVR